MPKLKEKEYIKAKKSIIHDIENKCDPKNSCFQQYLNNKDKQFKLYKGVTIFIFILLFLSIFSFVSLHYLPYPVHIIAVISILAGFFVYKTSDIHLKILDSMELAYFNDVERIYSIIENDKNKDSEMSRNIDLYLKKRRNRILTLERDVINDVISKPL